MSVPIKVNEIKADVELLATQGYSKNEIAEKLGINISTFYRWINEHEVLENAYKKGVAIRKKACTSIDVSDEIYNLSVNEVEKLIEVYGSKRLNRDFHIGMTYGYIMCYLENKK